MLDCKDYEKLIPDFLANKLDSEDAEKFIELGAERLGTSRVVGIAKKMK